MFIYNFAFYILIEVKLSVRRMCCSLEMKPLDQNKREFLFDKIIDSENNIISWNDNFKNYTTPWSNIESATLIKPAMFAPFI